MVFIYCAVLVPLAIIALAIVATVRDKRSSESAANFAVPLPKRVEDSRLGE